MATQNYRVLVKPDYTPVQVTGNTYWSFTGSGCTQISSVQSGNLVDVTIYTPCDTGVTQSQFNSYTGATEVRLQGIETDVLDNYNAITGLSTTLGALGVDFATYTGTTAPASFLPITGLTGYWNSGQTVSWVESQGYLTGTTGVYVPYSGASGGESSYIDNDGYIQLHTQNDAISGRTSVVYMDSSQVSLQVSHETNPLNEFRVLTDISYSRQGIDYLTPMSGLTFNDETLISREYADLRYLSITGGTTSLPFSAITGAVSGNTNLQAALDLKLDVSTYNADMLIISDLIDANTTGITANTASIATKLAIADFNTYTGTTAPAQFVDVSGDTMTGNLSVPSILIQTGTTGVTHEAGKFHWNTTDATADFGLLNGVILQLGQEIHAYVHAAEDLVNGDIVYMYGQGDEIRVLKAIADNTITAAAVGVVTQATIANGEWGYITMLGLVRDLDTTGIASGTQIWLSNSTAGAWETTMPEYPNQSMLVGKVIRGNHGSEGTLYVNPACNFKSQADYNTALGLALSAVTTGHTTQITALENFSAATITQWNDIKDVSGFIDNQNIDIAYNHTNRTITLTGTLTYYWNGIKHTLSSPWTSSGHTATEGDWYLYTTDGTNFIWSQTQWNFYDVQVAEIHYHADSGLTYGMRETHGTMPWSTHRELHQVIGTYHLSGGAAVAGTYTLDSDVDANKRPVFAQAVIADEDLASNIIQLSGATEGYNKMYVSGYTSGIYSASTNMFLAGASYLYVNNPQTGALTAGVSNRFYNIYQILVPVTSDAGSQKFRMVFLQPQATFTSLSAAQAEDVRGLYVGDLSETAEYVFYARVTFQTSASYTSTGKAAINGISYVLGTRASQVSVAGISATNHANLSNLTWLTSGHIATVNNTLASFNTSGVAELTPKATYTASGTTAALQSAFETYTGTTAPASFLPITGLTGYWTSAQTVAYVTGVTPTLEWGSITGTLSGQTDLQTALDFKLDTSAYNDDMIVLGGIIDTNLALFNTFTGTTAPATYATITNFNTFTGTTAPATYMPIGSSIDFSQVTGATSGSTALQSALDLKVDVAAYNDDMQILGADIDALQTGVTANTASILLKAAQADFETHSGNTAIHFEMSTITGFTSSDDFNTYTGTTVPALLGDKLETSVFTGFTATTAPATYQQKIATIYSVTGATTGTSAWSGNIVEADGTFTITLPDGLDAGTRIDIVNVGSGTITIAAETTLQSDGTLLETQYTGASCYNRGSDIWLAVGKLTTA